MHRTCLRLISYNFEGNEQFDEGIGRNECSLLTILFFYLNLQTREWPSYSLIFLINSFYSLHSFPPFFLIPNGLFVVENTYFMYLKAASSFSYCIHNNHVWFTRYERNDTYIGCMTYILSSIYDVCVVNSVWQHWQNKILQEYCFKKIIIIIYFSLFCLIKFITPQMLFSWLIVFQTFVNNKKKTLDYKSYRWKLMSQGEILLWIKNSYNISIIKDVKS